MENRRLSLNTSKVNGFVHSDPDYDYATGCDKIPYETVQEAHHVVSLMNKRYKNVKKRGKLRVYKCNVCGKHHTTSHKDRR